MNTLLLQIDNLVTESSVWLVKIKNMAIEYAPKIIGAILIYIIGSWLIKKVGHGLRVLMNKKSYDPTLQSFLVSLIKVSLTLLLFITMIGVLGVDITGFAALLAGAGLAIGAALNGSLGNLAGGVMIMIFRPYKVGDIIEAQGNVGVVQEIGIFSTVLLSPENKTIIIPNGPLSTGVISNYNTHGNLRVDMTFAIALNQDIDKAKEVIMQAMAAHPGVLQIPAPEVKVLKVADGMVTLAVRPYTTQEQYWDVTFGVQEAVKKALDKNGIEGPTPTRIIVNK